VVEIGWIGSTQGEYDIIFAECMNPASSSAVFVQHRLFGAVFYARRGALGHKKTGQNQFFYQSNNLMIIALR